MTVDPASVDHKYGQLRSRWVAGLLLSICLCALLATGYFYAQTVQRQNSITSSARENLLWASMQLEREVLRWRILIRTSDVAVSDLKLRFDILYSRYLTLAQGSLSERIVADDELRPLLERVGASLDELDTVVQEYSGREAPDQVFAEGTQRLQSLSNSLINEVVVLRSRNAASYRNNVESIRKLLSVSIAVLIGATMILVGFLIRGLVKERRQVAMVSALAERLDQTAEQANAANSAKSRFLATMSHEIRTPLSGILGMLDVLMDGAADAKQFGYLKAARASADHLLAIVNDILDMRSIEVGKMSISRKPFSLAALLEELSTAVRAQVRSKPIEFHLDQSDNLPDLVEGDSTRLRQVIVNLTNNAIKFTKAGDIWLSASWQAHHEDPDSGILRISVRDTGIGFDSNRSAPLFEDFSQIESAANRRYGGTGLGLSICKKLINMMGGTIGASSRVGEGSLFWFEIPVRKTEQSCCLESASVGYYGFDDADVDILHKGINAAFLAGFVVQLENTLPAGCRSVFVNWNASNQKTSEIISTLRRRHEHAISVIAVIEPGDTQAAYEFIKEGGDAMLPRPLDAEKVRHYLSELEQQEGEVPRQPA